jgi:hypothetical protein
LLLVVDPPLLTVAPPVLATAASRRAVFPPELGEVVPPIPPKVPPGLFVVEELDEHAASATVADRTNARLHWI